MVHDFVNCVEFYEVFSTIPRTKHQSYNYDITFYLYNYE
jgi:hypothetical protein